MVTMSNSVVRLSSTKNHDAVSPTLPSSCSTVPTFEAIVAGNTQGAFSRERFEVYSHERHCCEVLEFLIACQAYTQSYDAAMREDVPSIDSIVSLHNQWNSIMSTYVVEDSERWINTPSDVREKFRRLHSDGYNQVHDPCLLEEAISVSCEMLKENVYRGFVCDVLSGSLAAADNGPSSLPTPQTRHLSLPVAMASSPGLDALTGQTGNSWNFEKGPGKTSASHLPFNLFRRVRRRSPRPRSLVSFMP